MVAPGADIGEVANRVHSSLVDSFQRYEALLSRNENPFDPPQFHSVASFWLLEVWQLTQVLLGTSADALIEGLLGLQSVLHEMSLLPAVAEAEEVIPQFWSARPDEPERLLQLHAGLV
jgi:hypothetical protein